MKIKLEDLEIGHNYRIVHQSELQRYPRYSVMTYLGTALDNDTSTVWSARPVAGTQSMLNRDIIGIEPAQEGDRICINGRASSHQQSGG